MQINNFSNNTSFSGYKNVLANKVTRPNGEKITFMSMQLDNLKSNDLSTWNYIQKNFLERKANSDVVTFSLVEADDMHLLSFSDIILDTDSVEPNTKEESLMLKTFSFLASLTKRISEDCNLVRDEDLNCMVFQTKNDLKDLLFSNLQNSNELDNAVFGSLYSLDAPQDYAKNINNKISDQMIDYFS